MATRLQQVTVVGTVALAAAGSVHVLCGTGFANPDVTAIGRMEVRPVTVH